jgi:hypothetical protein
MTLNVWSITSLFLSGVSFMLALCMMLVALRSFPVMPAKAQISLLEKTEDRSQLLVLVVVVLALVRLLAWPYFYLLLKSYVPELAAYGVMCAYGVTRIQAGWVLAVEILKPLTLFSLGFWWLLNLVDRRSATAPMIGLRIVLAIPLSVLALLDCSAEAIYVLLKKVGHPITCCTRFLDTEAQQPLTDNRFMAAVGFGSPLAGLVLFFVLNLLVITLALYCGRRRAGAPRRPVLLSTGLALLASCNLVVTWWIWLQTVAPRVLQLPYHHCLYEVLTDVPALGIAAILAIAGNTCLLWPVGLQLFRHRAPAEIDSIVRAVDVRCGVAIASSLLIVVVHLV